MPHAALEYAVYALYFLVGPGMWGLYAIGMYQAQKRMDLLKRPRDPVPAPPPPVTILIPAKDEQERIGDCLRSALAQDYNNFQVVAIDDRSTDGTGAAMDELAAKDARLSVVHIPHGDLPAGWTGKCHALLAWSVCCRAWKAARSGRGCLCPWPGRRWRPCSLPPSTITISSPTPPSPTGNSCSCGATRTMPLAGTKRCGTNIARTWSWPGFSSATATAPA